MRLIHLSDLHFGTETPSLLQELQECIKNAQVDCVIISGDFTQVGTRREFLLARNFLSALPVPYLCVPGNHDVPRFDLWERLTDPLHDYKEYIEGNLSPVLRKDNVCITGINTARGVLPHWNWANGAISEQQIKHLQNVFSTCPGETKICVMHHPVHIAKDHNFKTVVFGGAKALAAMKAMKIDLVLTGHVHHASITTIEDNNHKTIFLSASTALSRRLRGQGNGYNIISIEHDVIGIEIFSYTKSAFEKQEVFAQKRTA